MPIRHMCVSGFSSEKTRYGRSALSFSFTRIFYTDIAFSLYFHPFFSIFDYIFLKIHNKMFRVGAKNPGRVGKPETHIYYFLALWGIACFSLRLVVNSVGIRWGSGVILFSLVQSSLFLALFCQN